MRPNGLLGSREARRMVGGEMQSSAGDGPGLCSAPPAVLQGLGARSAPGTWGGGTGISRGFFSSGTVGHLHALAARRPHQCEEMVVQGKAVACLRLRDCWLSDLPTLLLLLLLLRPPATLGATCSTPTSVEHANIQVKSYNENSRERYICNFGFKRKAGTSSLTKCLRNEDTNITQWTIPSLKCIRDPSLTRPRPPSTVAPAGVTPEPDSPSPSGKEPAFTFKSDTTTATKPGTTPGSRLMTPKLPSAETTEVIGNKPSQDQSQTTTKALEHTPSASPEKPGAYAYNSTTVTVAVSIPVLVICGVCVAFLLVCYCKKSRQNSWTPSVQMEDMEDRPMTGGTDSREGGAENHHPA